MALHVLPAYLQCCKGAGVGGCPVISIWSLPALQQTDTQKLSKGSISEESTQSLESHAKPFCACVCKVGIRGRPRDVPQAPSTS